MSLADVLHQAETDKDEWHSKHQGPLIDIRANVWWCGDYWCDCTQAQITAQFRNATDYTGHWIVPRTLWEGEFHSEGERGAKDELAAKRAEVERDEPEMAARIIWPPVEQEDSPAKK